MSNVPMAGTNVPTAGSNVPMSAAPPTVGTKRPGAAAFAFAAACRCNVEFCARHAPTAQEYQKVVLGDAIIPSAYELDLKLRLEEHAFDGRVRIIIDVKVEGLTAITLHAVDLAISEARIVPLNAGAVLTAQSIELDARMAMMGKGTATFTFERPLPLGSQHLIIEYTGVLNDQMDGFYRSYYTDRQGERKMMASTFFCATSARKCLPCWDEPLRKAKFTCSLTVPTHLTALSNTPEVESVEGVDGTKRVRFQTTPRMSTYLLAFVVGEVPTLRLEPMTSRSDL